MMTIQSFGKQTFSVVFLMLVSIASLNPITVFAQADDALVLEEIVVTAQRREQSLQEVPISVEVFSGGSIWRQQRVETDAQ